MEAIYPGDGDREAVPGLCPETAGAAGVPPRLLDVDGEMFALRPDGSGGTCYTWLSGPDPGYGFGAGPTANLSLDEHRENIRGFLAMVDPGTGHVEDD